MTHNEILTILKQIPFFPSGAVPAQNNIFPPIAVLNDLLANGHHEHGMGNEFAWTPMTITFEHYMNLFGELKILNSNLTYIQPPAEIVNYADWVTWLLCREVSPDTKQYYQELFKLVELLGNRVNYLQNHDEANASLPSLMKYLVELSTELSSFIKGDNKHHVNQPTTTSHEIHFYSTKTAYGFLSNFYKAPFTLEHKSWKTVEHYFQAKKFEGSEYEEAIRHASTATEAAKLGRNRKIPMRSDWEEVKEAIMLQALSAKFTQNTQLKEELLQTGNATLIERTAKDRYWGDGGDGSGENRLGILLMQVRDQLLHE